MVELPELSEVEVVLPGVGGCGDGGSDGPGGRGAPAGTHAGDRGNGLGNGPGTDPGTDPDRWVEQQLRRLGAEYVDLVPVGRAAQPGDVVRLALRATVEGSRAGHDGWAPQEGVEVELGAGRLFEGFDEALAGLGAGQETTVVTRVPSGPDEGREAHVTVLLQEVLEQQEPELDDALAAAVGPFATLEELRSVLRAHFDREQRADLLITARDAVLDAVVTAAGLDPADPAGRYAVLDALAESAGIQVTVEELRALIATEMDRSGVSARTFRKALARDGIGVQLHEYARREKALVHLLTHVVVKDPAGEVVPLADWLVPGHPAADRTASRSAGQFVSRPACQSVTQTVGQAAGESTGSSASQPAGDPVSP